MPSIGPRRCSLPVRWRGRSAESIADTPELFETDRFFRRVGLYLNLAREVSQLDDATFSQLTAYCEGVNDGMKQAGRSLPMWATRFQPQPWNQEAVLLIGNWLNYGGLVVSQQQNERLIIELIQTGVRRDMLQELFSPRSRSSRLRADSPDQDCQPVVGRSPGIDCRSAPPGRQQRLGSFTPAQRQRHGPVGLGSAPGSQSASGHLVRSRFALGRSLRHGGVAPRLSAVCRSADRAIGLGRDVPQGRYQRLFHRGLPPRGQCLAISPRAGLAQLRRAREVIRGKSGQSETLQIYHNELGTLETTPESNDPGLFLLTAWTGSREGVGRSLATWLRMIDSQSTIEAMNVARECPQPTLCWVFADADGHIGRQANGWIPRRGGGHQGLLPIPAWDPANHWQGWLPSGELPSVYDPPEGFISSANESLDPPGVIKLVSQPLADYRKRRIDERLRALPRPHWPTCKRAVRRGERRGAAICSKCSCRIWSRAKSRTGWRLGIARTIRKVSKPRSLRGCIAMCCWRSSATRGPNAADWAGGGCSTFAPGQVSR